MAQPLRILLTALGGEGGGVLMNWLVEAARSAKLPVQATSVPGVAQRTGSTSYYIEIGGGSEPEVFNLVPMPGRVDVVVSSELVETGRILSAGYISPDRTTLISSTARALTTAEKIEMGDGRYSTDRIREAGEKLAKTAYFLDLGKLATEHKTYVSATLLGALSASGVLPWSPDHTRSVIGDQGSWPGFDAASAALENLKSDENHANAGPTSRNEEVPESLNAVVALGVDRATDYQDAEYGRLYSERANRLISRADLDNHEVLHAVTEACRRLALWMCYEDIARVADLKTRAERFENIRQEVQLAPGQILLVTEFMKPRVEEIADVIPRRFGNWLRAHGQRGGWVPFVGKGRRIRSNGVFGYWMLRYVAQFRRLRRHSLRFGEEQAAIEEWMEITGSALAEAPAFAAAVAELPRVLKGYSDTMARGKCAYDRIMADIVRPALADGTMNKNADRLREALAAALADDRHENLDRVLGGTPESPEIPNLKVASHA